jgi:spore maturation protein CgeB
MTRYPPKGKSEVSTRMISGLRIVYFWSDDGRNISDWQRRQFLNDLQNEGAQIEVFNPLHFESIACANQRFLELLACGKACDVIMTCMGDDVFLPETAAQVARLGIPSLLICFDNLHAPHMHRRICRHFNLVWITSKETMGIFKNWGANVIFQPYAASPVTMHISERSETPAVAFVGSLYGVRTHRINSIVGAGIRCDVYSDDNVRRDGVRVSWLKILSDGVMKFPLRVEQAAALATFDVGRRVLAAYGLKTLEMFSKTRSSRLLIDGVRRYGGVQYEEMGAVFARYALSLSSSELRNTFLLTRPVHKLHLRTFEIPMAGGLQFAPRVDELLEYFEEDSEVVCFGCEEEMIDKARFYTRIDNLDIRHRMKQRARLRAQSEHTWVQRFMAAFVELQVIKKKVSGRR